MTFAALNAEVAELRSALRSYAGVDAIPEVTVRPPAGMRDEASFLRLVSWSYALLFEVGRVTVPYLLRLPANGPCAEVNVASSREVVRTLRTWSFHNLGLADHDLHVSRNATNWFMKQCGSISPRSCGDWELCFSSLCHLVIGVMVHCKKVVSTILSAPDDGMDIIGDLKQRLNRNWPVHEFDKIVNDVCYRLGEKIDTPKFRAPRITKWRSYLDNLADDVDIYAQVTRFIERDVLDYFNKLLPIHGGDLMDYLSVGPGPHVRMALNVARQLWESGVKERHTLLEQTAVWYQSEDGPSG